ncbi:MAG: ABC transporter permease subunit [Burkholderiales bacterium]|nr:MAG: ABC transporter permease subunit [Betaproteobacteria bacterium]TAG24169.1 MAG: ABC transporter permease subunit [Burkholderiales bacterium]TAG48187.1 MAG: ABC transporter permease subunit [Betaproteobacteria bacterium]
MQRSRFGLGWMTVVFLFLYLPIFTLVVFSFNDSKLATQWGGFTLKWYAEILNDREVREALWLSLKIAFLTATASVVLGTLAAFAMVRYTKFKGRTLFSGMVNAPLVMPEVIIGLSLLLMLVSVQRAFGVPERGVLTIWLGHSLLGMAYAAVVVQSRLLELDKSLEEAAMDLGCRPHEVFRLVTLPMIAPSLLSAWLLTFTISLDDVVLSAFLSGPGSTTLPIVIFSRARLGMSPTINAIAAIMIFIVAAGVIFGSLWLARAEKRRAEEQAAAYREALPSP